MKKLSRYAGFLFPAFVMATTMLIGLEPTSEQERVSIGTRSTETALETETNSGGQEGVNNALLAKAGYTSASSYKPSVATAYHNLEVIYPASRVIELEDGSQWLYSANDGKTLLKWFATDPLLIVPNKTLFSSYDFRIVNVNTNEYVSVLLSQGPHVYGSYTHWIIAVDYYYNYVYLEDGSYWNMSAFDSDIVAQWMAGDYVIIGTTDRWLNPDMLINVTMATYAVGKAN